MHHYTVEIPAAKSGVHRRQLKVNWGQQSCYVDVGLRAETAEVDAGPHAIARLLNYDEQGHLQRGERVPLVGRDPAPRAARRKPVAPAEPEVESDGGADRSLSRLNREQLLALCDERQIALVGNESKKQLIALLERAPDSEGANDAGGH